MPRHQIIKYGKRTKKINNTFGLHKDNTQLLPDQIITFQSITLTFKLHADFINCDYNQINYFHHSISLAILIFLNTQNEYELKSIAI